MNQVTAYTKERRQQLPAMANFFAEYTPLVQRIAHHIMMRLPASVDVSDLIQAGMLGLWDAYQHFDASKGAQLKTYATIRIKGAIFDELRRCHLGTRTSQRAGKELARAIASVEQLHGRVAHDSEIAQHLGITIPDYQKMLVDSVQPQYCSFEDVGISEETLSDKPINAIPGFDELATDEEFQQRLAEAIAALPKREALVLSLYYHEELNFKEIGAVLDVSESRVCQLHARAMLRLQVTLGQWMIAE